MRQVFLDTETTGLSAEQGDRIVEIGCIEMENRRLTGRTLHHYLNPERSSHPDAVRVHGLTDEFLADKPLFADRVEEFLAFIGEDQLVIHNAQFDIGFLNAELERVGRTKLANSYVDTVSMARRKFPAAVGRHCPRRLAACVSRCSPPRPSSAALRRTKMC